ncbi:hypothetical protein COL0002_01000 [Helicobacter pylori]
MKAFLILFFLFVFIAFFVVAAMSETLEKAWEFDRKYYILNYWYFNFYFV